MEQIRLTKDEKKSLRYLSLGFVYPPDGMSEAAWNTSLRSLQRQGLAKVAFVEGRKVEDAAITDDGKAHIEQNPTLRNPIDWAKISAIAAISSVVIAILALFISCFSFYVTKG